MTIEMIDKWVTSFRYNEIKNKKIILKNQKNQQQQQQQQQQQKSCRSVLLVLDCIISKQSLK